MALQVKRVFKTFMKVNFNNMPTIASLYLYRNQLQQASTVKQDLTLIDLVQAI
jgi:hypothetical protein